MHKLKVGILLLNGLAFALGGVQYNREPFNNHVQVLGKRDVNNPFPSNLPSNYYLPPISGDADTGRGNYRPAPQRPATSPPAFNPPPFQPNPQNPSRDSSSSECQRQDVGGGRYKFVCPQNAPSLRSEHVLWLTQNGGATQVVDIEVPNYKIQELIKAGFKSGGPGSTQVNVLLKRPETSVDAQIDQIRQGPGGPPNVRVQYEPVEKQLIHFPNDRPYSPLQGPILPPLNDRSSG